jgi:hypothetical protein
MISAVGGSVKRVLKKLQNIILPIHLILGKI